MSTNTDITDNQNHISGYYQTPDVSQRLDLIKHLLANTSLTPYVQATDGSGKSRLAQHLKETLADRYSVDLMNGSSVSILTEIQQHIADFTGLAEVNDQQLADHFSKLAEQRKNYLLILDDADQVSADGLTWLIDFYKSNSASCQCKLVILASLDVLALPLSPVMAGYLTDHSQVMDIPRLTAAQIPAFIRSIDEDKAILLKESDYQNLFKNTSGIPGKILWLLQYVDQPQQTLETGEIPDLTPTPKKHKRNLLPWTGAVLIGAVLLTILIFQDEINKLVESKPEANQLELTIPPKPVKFTSKPELAEKADAIQLPAPTEEQETAALTTSNNDSENLAENVTEIKPVDGADLQPVKKESLLPEKTSLANKQQKTETVAEQNTDVKEETLQNPQVSEVAKKPLQTTEPAEILKKLDKQNSEPVSTIEKPLVKKQEPQPQKPVLTIAKAEPVQPVKPVVKNIATKKSGFRTLKWLIEQKKNTYTLQLTAAGDKKGIDRFIKKHNLSGDMVVLVTRRDNKPWYSLLYGAYPSRNDAVAASKKLPKSYKSSSAWARSITSVKQSGGVSAR